MKRRSRAEKTFLMCMLTNGFVLGASPVFAAKDDPVQHQLEEVWVTAQKRQQSLQAAPISISVMDSRALEIQGIVSFKGFENGAIPSLQVMPVGNTPSNRVVSIRGNAPGDPSEVTREGSVAIYLDGVYVARSQGLGMELADVERIEVLRGPQGSLFGRNAIGGAISIVSKQPSGEFGIDQTVGVGRFDERRSVSHINFPEVAGMSTKLDYLHSERDGWVDNTAPGESDYNEYKKDGGRFSLLWPINESVELSYSYDKSRVSTAQSYFQFFEDTLGLFGRELERQTKTRAPVIPLQPTTSDHAGHSLSMTWLPSESLSVKSISAYRTLKEQSNNNYGGVLYYNGLNDASWLAQKQFTQEFQLLGAHERLEWVAGLYYLREDLDKTIQDSFTLDIFNVFGNGFRSPIIPSTTFDALATGTFLPPKIVNSTAHSKAVYGQLTWNPEVLGDKLFVTVGGRQTDDSRRASRFEVSLDKSTQSSNHFDSTFALDYRWSENVSSYLKRSTAYKAGGVNTRSTSFLPFNEEIAKTIELGFKSEFLDRRARFNAALFSTRYENMQMDFSDPVIVTLLETLNVDKTVEVKGFEMDFTLSLTPNLMLGLSYTYLDTHMPLQANPLAEGALKQFSVPLAPNHAGALNVDYRFQAGAWGAVSAHLNVSSTDHYAYTPFALQRRDAYTIVNGRLKVDDIHFGRDSGKFSISVWGKNILDAEYIIYAFAIGDPLVSMGQAFGDPRTLGVDVNYEF